MFRVLDDDTQPVWLGAPLHQSDGILSELLQRFDLLGNLVHRCFYLQKEFTRIY